MKIFIGIDPGKSGGIAIIKEDGSYLLIDMPINPNDEISSLMIYQLFCNEIDFNKDQIYCCLEKAQSMPGQGVTSVFNYGQGYGKIKAVLEILKIPYEEIRPLKWKKEFSLDKDKVKSVSLAQKLFPMEIFVTQRGRLLDGRAEAILLAEYARRNYK